jgi:hypothetical protein
MPAPASALHVITLAIALLSACLCMTGLSPFPHVPHFQASSMSTISLDPSRHIVVQPYLTGPVIMLYGGSRLGRMAVGHASSSRWVKMCLHLPHALGTSLMEKKKISVHTHVTSVMLSGQPNPLWSAGKVSAPPLSNAWGQISAECSHST